MIQSFYRNNVTPDMPIEKRNDLERITRLINLESRINRMELGLLMENTFKTKVKARMMKPFNATEHTYVFMPLNEDNWKSKETELGLRCIVARATFPNAKRVIGVAVGGPSFENMTFDLHYLDIPEIDDKFLAYADKIKNELGYFKNIRETHSKGMR